MKYRIKKISALSLLTISVLVGGCSTFNMVENGQSLIQPKEFEESKSQSLKISEQEACESGLKRFEKALADAHAENQFLAVDVDKTAPYGLVIKDMVTVPNGGYSIEANDPFRPSLVPEDAPIWKSKSCSITLIYDVDTDSDLIDLNTQFIQYIKSKTGYAFSFMPISKKMLK
ncbi:hypothetical protein E6W26_29165 [Pseudomonas aeruginosa]|uniref:hypothetical protein n=1 Tax=Pseudomonas aeruginosa TaxID=287 RepID=UPI00109DE726|nr:hypothetical protein [Pseudomonas aeruginosa]EKV1241254.1 hypothetical protein [Pseudomonas aeruginosa]EKV8586163.1 hypothetical protein [Pseudomonas aeruginosa]ELN5407381.1 hypothetical protein [Pseudomonas aeruginosa]ELP1438572.1 hypothetical protein [Pseudomonas aeruginosa]THB16470.1 hypothetical protein E6W26_29165 [Pseudomonas aeruginosa]